MSARVTMLMMMVEEAKNEQNAQKTPRDTYTRERESQKANGICHTHRGEEGWLRFSLARRWYRSQMIPKVHRQTPRRLSLRPMTSLGL